MRRRRRSAHFEFFPNRLELFFSTRRGAEGGACPAKLLHLPGHCTAVFDLLHIWSVHVQRIIACLCVLFEHITLKIISSILVMVGYA